MQTRKVVVRHGRIEMVVDVVMDIVLTPLNSSVSRGTIVFIIVALVRRFEFSRGGARDSTRPSVT
jgi:hypothetical protein